MSVLAGSETVGEERDADSEDILVLRECGTLGEERVGEVAGRGGTLWLILRGETRAADF
jgi:hypothetical protein